MEASPLQGERPNEHSYAAFLDSCGPGPSLSAARSLWQRLTRNGELPGPRLCVSLLCVLGRAGEVVEAEELLKRLSWNGAANLRSYNAALTACAASGAWSAALRVWASFLQEEALSPDSLSLSLMLSACNKGAAWAEGLALALPALPRIRDLDGPACGSLLTVAARAQRPDIVLAVWRSIRPSLYSTRLCNCYLAALARFGDAPTAREALAAMVRQRVPRDVRSYTCVCAAETRSVAVPPGERLARVRGHINAMLAGGIAPTEVTLNVLAVALGDAGLWREAVDSTSRFSQRFSLPPSEMLQTTLIRACVRSGEMDEALRLFRGMQADGLLPSQATFALLMSALDDAGQADRRAELLELQRSLAVIGELRDRRAEEAEARAFEDAPGEGSESFAPGAWASWAVAEANAARAKGRARNYVSRAQRSEAAARQTSIEYRVSSI
jgi:pentatricopeptide repeat protein